MPIPTEPIGSIPRPARLIRAARDREAGLIAEPDYDVVLDESVRDTIQEFEATGSPVITDGEQAKPSFATYPLQGLRALAPDGVNHPIRRRPHQTTAPPYGWSVPVCSAS